MKRLLVALALLLPSPARAEAVISLPETFQTTIYQWWAMEIPVYISEFTNPTGLGARWVEVNVLPSPGLTIRAPLTIGPWTISGNPNGYYGWRTFYVDLWQMAAAWINDNATREPGCITQPTGLVFSLQVIRNQYWSGRETLTFGRSIKAVGPMPNMLDCGGNQLPIRYGNSVCVVSFPDGSEEPDEGGCCMDSPVTTTLEGPRPIFRKPPMTWGRIKAMYR